MRLYYPARFQAGVARWAGVLELRSSERPPVDMADLFLWYDGARLRLMRGGDRRGVCVRAARVRSRASLAGALARACGVSRRHRPCILDAMAGLGNDGLALATLGCHVTLIERHPALWALLDDYLRVHPLPRTRLELGDCETFRGPGAQWDVVYLDPMFPLRGKTALPAKAMQYLRLLLGSSEDDPVDVAAWRASARERVVVKRRRSDPALAKPDWQIRSTTVRYDVYRAAAAA